MGCWGSGIGQDDGFLDDLFHIQNELQWRGYKDNLEYITAQHFNENCHLISEKIAKGFPLNENSCYSCWFQVLAHLVMKIGGRMSLEMKQQCMLASRPENDYQDPGAWFKEESLLERNRALATFYQEIENYYHSQPEIMGNELERDY